MKRLLALVVPIGAMIARPSASASADSEWAFIRILSVSNPL